MKNVDKISYFKAELLKFQGKIEAILKATTKENKFFSLSLYKSKHTLQAEPFLTVNMLCIKR